MTGSFFGKKFPGHSRQPGQDKDLNDQTPASTPLVRTPLPPTTLPYHLSSLLKISSPSTVDSSLRTMVAHISDPLTHPISTSDLNTSPNDITLTKSAARDLQETRGNTRKRKDRRQLNWKQEDWNKSLFLLSWWIDLYAEKTLKSLLVIFLS